jgi:hypothetical protein
VEEARWEVRSTQLGQNRERERKKERERERERECGWRLAKGGEATNREREIKKESWRRATGRTRDWHVSNRTQLPPILIGEAKRCH